MDDHKLKSKWESSNNNFNLMFDNKDYNYGYDGMSWRQRNFMCNFCKKEYKSAQALGGHMNVHRRDRARLRLSSPSQLLADHPNPNPNPNIFSSPPSSNSSSLLCLPNYRTLHSSLFPLSSPSLTININQDQQQEIMLVPHSSSARNLLGDHVMRNFNGNSCVDQEKEKESRVWKRRECCMVEMEMDLLKDGKIDMGLDLELRLGRP